MTTTDSTSPVADWLRRTAHPLAGSSPDMALTDLRPLRDIIGDAVVVGLGETTRAGHEVAGLGHRVLRFLVEEMGFRVLALQDGEGAVARMDRYITSGEGDPRSAPAEMWTPWRTEEMADLLRWARASNQRHAADPLRLVGLDPTQAQPGDYDAVLEHALRGDPALAEELRERYDVIRTAHDLPEHVQLAQGLHPGRPFTELAQEALELVEALPPTEGAQDALARARHIVDFHADSIAGGFDYGVMRRRTVARLTSLVREGGKKVVYWDGVALTANARRLEPVALFDAPFQTVGSALRDELGAGYVSLLLTFGFGDLGELHHGQRAPEPRADSLNAVLTATGPECYLLDLRAPDGAAVTAWLRGRHLLRAIGGIYDADADSEHYLRTGPLDEWFDALLHIDTITATTLL